MICFVRPTTLEQKQYRSMQTRRNAAQYGFYGLCATVAASLIGGVYGTCSWEATRRDKLNNAVKNDLTAQGFVAKEVLSVVFVSPPLRPSATLQIGNCHLSFDVERQDKHWVIDPQSLSRVSELDIPRHTPVTPSVVSQAFPECFSK